MAERAVQDRSIAELVQDMSDQIRRLVRDEMRLAADELKQKGRRAGVGAGLAGLAGMLAAYGGIALVAAAVFALALVLPAWLSALLVGAALLLAGGLAGLMGRRSLRAATPPVPEEAAANVAKDVQAVRGHA
ncbi:MAG TPA: phage holin family protein [Amycolatopsis sp.]|uniref:phage holin family protein n=1 Tax=Amycolatopsis sp. TaxID=37632 RepID=UPI002B48835C|nr:phage holin family protein [Amycolatopsis sp.]HKS47914.1 phage holin family protein [Amycolatopsis sp.]